MPKGLTHSDMVRPYPPHPLSLFGQSERNRHFSIDVFPTVPNLALCQNTPSVHIQLKTSNYHLCKRDDTRKVRNYHLFTRFKQQQTNLHTRALFSANYLKSHFPEGQMNYLFVLPQSFSGPEAFLTNAARDIEFLCMIIFDVIPYNGAV